MLVKYNSLNKTDPPIFTLCNPGSIYNKGYLTNVVGILTDHEAEEIVFNFNSVSELNFRINKVARKSGDENDYINRMYDNVQNRRLIFIADIGYFMITNIENGYQNGVDYKDVTAESIEVEIQQKNIPYIEDGTYRFLTDGAETTKGIFNKIVEVLPLWTIGHIDETVAAKWRTFEDVDVTLNCLGFLIDNIQDAYECIIIFDDIHRIINVYDQSNYVKKTYIHITKDDMIKSINITENADDIYTAINVSGSNDIGISAINPLGGNVIYNFNYYIDWMSSELGQKVRKWQNDVNNAKTSYYENNLNYYDKLEEASNLQSDIDNINTQITMYNRCKDNIIAQSDTTLVDEYNTAIIKSGGAKIVVYKEIADTINAINNQISACKKEKNEVQSDLNAVKDKLDVYKNNIEKINKQLAILNYFTQTEYEELSNYIFEGNYNDEYITITDIMTYSEKFAQMKILHDRAEQQLARASEPTQEFDVDAESVIFEKSFSAWNDQLETGCLINVELKQNDVALLFLSSITINYDDQSLKFTFGNRFNKYDPKSLFENVLGSITKSANTLNYIKDILYPIKGGTFDEMKEAIQSSRNLTMSGALISEREEVIIDGSGYTGRSLLDDGTYDPRQIKITGKNIVLTDDAWDTCKVAIGEILLGEYGKTYGVNAETLIGELIIGERLILSNPQGTARFDEDGLNIYNTHNAFMLNPNGNTLFSITKDGHEILGLDSEGSLHVEADGKGINLSSNSEIQEINAKLQVHADSITAEVNRATEREDSLSSKISQTAQEVKSVVSSAVSKYDTSSLEYPIDLYGYGTASGNYDASENDGRYYLDQTNGFVYKSNGSAWLYQTRLQLITVNLQSQITQTAEEIKSIIRSDINGLQTQITQNANSISLKVDEGNFGTLIQQNSENIKIAWNNISKYIQFENGELQIYKDETGSPNSLLMKLCSNGNYYYYQGVRMGMIGTTGWVGDNDYRCLIFGLSTYGDCMAWGYQDDIDGNYNAKMVYHANNKKDKKGFHFSDYTYYNYNTYFNARAYLNENVHTIRYEDGNAGLYSETHEVSIVGKTAKVKGSGGCFEINDTRFIFNNSPDLTFDCYNNIDLHNYSILNNSDIRLKTNICDTDINALDLLNKIDLKSFDWIEDNKHENIGIIAQQLQEIIPNLVHEDKETSKLSIDQIKLIPYIIKAIQELSSITNNNISRKSVMTKQSAVVSNDDVYAKYSLAEKQKFVDLLQSKREVKPQTEEVIEYEPVYI